MLYVVSGYFQLGVEAARLKVHENFNEHLRQRVAKVRFGGPLFDDRGSRIGELLVVEAADRNLAEAFLKRRSLYADRNCGDKAGGWSSAVAVALGVSRTLVLIDRDYQP